MIFVPVPYPIPCTETKGIKYSNKLAMIMMEEANSTMMEEAIGNHSITNLKTSFKLNGLEMTLRMPCLCFPSVWENPLLNILRGISDHLITVLFLKH